MSTRWIILFSFLFCLDVSGADADGFDYPFGPPNGLPRCPGTAQCSDGWQNVQDFRLNNHLGEDWNLGFGNDDLGKPVFAAANGEVIYARDVGGDGSWRGVIIIRHTGTGFRLVGGGSVQEVTSMYAHLDPATINQWVVVGSQVARGQQIGVIGPTPVGSTGPHLHFEIRTNLTIEVGPGYGSNSAGWVDPSDFIAANRSVASDRDGAIASRYEFRTVAGLAEINGSSDGSGSAARFYNPGGLAVDSAGNLYVADFGNHTIRRIAPNGMVTTVAGRPQSSGGADGPGSSARFNRPSGVAVDSAGTLYVADEGNHTIRRIAGNGNVSTFAGFTGTSGDIDGVGTSARFYFPIDVAVDGGGNLYVADYGNNTIRKITSNRVVKNAGWISWYSGQYRRIRRVSAVQTPNGVGGRRRWKRVCGGCI